MLKKTGSKAKYIHLCHVHNAKLGVNLCVNAEFVYELDIISTDI